MLKPKTYYNYIKYDIITCIHCSR